MRLCMRTKSSASLLILIKLMVMISSLDCNNNKNPVIPPEIYTCIDTLESLDRNDVLIPLSTGNYWSYHQYWGEEYGGSLIDSLKVQITGQTIVNNDGHCYNVYLWNWIYLETGEFSDTDWFYWNGDSGLYLLGGMNSRDILVEAILKLRYPVLPGETWQVLHLVYNYYEGKFIFEDTLTYQCIATDTEFETLVGTFICHEYHYRIHPEEDVLEDWDVYNYYAPGIGPVGLVVKSSLNGFIKWRRVLFSYKIN